MIAVTVINLIRLQFDLWWQFEIAQGLRKLYCIKRLLLVCNERKRHCRGVAKPMARGWHLTVVAFANLSDEFCHVRHSGLFPIPFKHPDADTGFRWQAG